MSIEASLYVSSSAWSRAVSSRPHSLVSLQPHGGKAVDGWADPLVGSSSLSVTGSLHRGKAIVGEVDPLVGSSLPLLSIKGSSHTNIFKTTLIQSQQMGWSNDSFINVIAKVGAWPVSLEGPYSILDILAGAVVSISLVVSMVRQGLKVGRDYVSPLVSFAQPIVSSVVSVDELDDRPVAIGLAMMDVVIM
ncbi:hypothetical protein LWI29_034893 [Acer saccharum]|uniref:Uncharacterized protein n=1 Tax=Acer saccharum TaxID=4024 RepID=A0AA39S968_ACESA|nr:hypothetical protein LWI29_034893 [Acer saccharum]